jgi:predicted small secreted protein
MKKIALLVLVWMLAGCNTMEGVGKDLKQGGEAIQKAATK